MPSVPARACLSRNLTYPSSPPFSSTSFMTPADLNILWMPDLRARSQPVGSRVGLSFCLVKGSRTHKPARHCMQASTTQSATTPAPPTHSLPQVMNADRFDGPYANLCNRQPVKAASSSSSSSSNNSGGGSYSNTQVRITEQYLSS